MPEELSTHFLVFVDSKETDPMELGQLRQQYAEQWGSVDDEMRSVVFGIEAGQQVEYNRRDAKELSGGGEL